MLVFSSNAKLIGEYAGPVVFDDVVNYVTKVLSFHLVGDAPPGSCFVANRRVIVHENLGGVTFKLFSFASGLEAAVIKLAFADVRENPAGSRLCWAVGGVTELSR